jgi:membrane-bound lytic murein transglycosylase D
MTEGSGLDEPTVADVGTETETELGADISGELVAEAIATSEVTEPLTAAAEEAAGPGLVPGGQPAASPDPADYSLGSDGSLTVQGSETLGQLARWLGTDLARLRQWNGLKPRSALSMGRRLKVDLRGIDSASFERERLLWHRTQQAAYFRQMRIVGIDHHQMRVGESLWSLTQRHAVPPWLLQQYNPDLDFAAVRVGTEIILPRVREASVGGPE